MNLVRAGGLIDELQIMGDVLAGLRAGLTEIHNSLFGYRTAAMIWAVGQALAGQPVPTDPPPPAVVVPALLGSARIQLVKCSPFQRPLSKPFPEMNAQCPTRYLLGDLRLLRARVLLVVHSLARGEVWKQCQPHPWTDRPGLSFGRFELDGNSVIVLAPYHPSDRRWPGVAWPQLRQVLAEGSLNW